MFKFIKNFRHKHPNILLAFIYVIVITLIIMAFNRFFYSPIMVVGSSMSPALSDNDLIIVNKIVYDFNEIERFDIVVFPYKYDHSLNMVKRIVGLPGETVEIKNNVIYIDDSPLEEYYGFYDKDFESKYENLSPITLSIDEYFVMGDNRNVSEDSRSEDVGPVKADTIIGRAVFRMWPFNGIGSLEYQ
ncbi:MAG: signal peptidase I [Clostridiales bacterium]|nr:signal peptidase I [Clostridiales bacterium]